ncbi:ABC transporter permease [Brachybacterium saurashtrense]|uniref:ABC transporter permease n=1 Tax=Brachybacterium saurashtrense TaxID=556288 RepID=A0A345YM39_9MICO|nr:ABC transporter permease [Brachybacterium saurashtrense]AXK44991.1 ABC transporter permease [Brachybacterium saurashtrense]RRR21675.1 ABC transporter permease [Brachybacterium saurashtrense]
MTAPQQARADAPADRSPHPAPPLRRVLAHAAMETRIMLSNGEQLTVAVALPAMVLIGLWLLPLGRLEGVPSIDTAVAATFATALISTSFTSQAILTGFDRRNGVLRWVATTPLGRDGYLAGKILATLATHVLQVLVLGAIALIIGWRPELGGLLGAVPVWLVGTVAFGALGLLVAGTLRTEAVLAVSNLLFLLLVSVGGVAFPASSYPRILGGLVDLLPSGALGELMRACLAQGPFSPGSALVLMVWAVAGVAAVVRWFRWTDS